MKKKSIISLLIGLLGFGSLTTSCEDMLTPDMDRYTEGFNGTDTVNFYLGILRTVQDMVEQNIVLGEIRGDLADTTLYTSDSIADIANFKQIPDGENSLLSRAAYYKVINQCNFYLAKVDTLAQKNNIYYMRKEAAQVQLIRAWVYMQLVQNYGRVPFITRPVDNANTGWETNPESWADPDNLLDLLEKDLQQAATYEKASNYGFPNYGTFKTGAVDLAHSLMLFRSDLILGDLYLLRGRSVEDYEKAATYYYNYLFGQYTIQSVSGSYAAKYGRFYAGSSKDNYTYTPNPTSWTANLSGTGGLITGIPSAANASIGKVLTRVPNIYGFDIHSSNSTGTSGNETVVNGRISITANPRTRQIGPSQHYMALCQSQIYLGVSDRKAGETEDKLEVYQGVGDARMEGSAPRVLTTDDGYVRFIDKFGFLGSYNDYTYPSNFTFRYILNLYRYRQVLLRYAEAINRAGFPMYAYAILRDGLSIGQSAGSLPTLSAEVLPEADTVRVAGVDGAPDTLRIYKQSYYTMDYQEGSPLISVDECYRASEKIYLMFTESMSNVGINRLGCGTPARDLMDTDTLTNYYRRVGDRIIQEAQRSGRDVAAARRVVRSLAASKAVAKVGALAEGDADVDEDNVVVEEIILDPEVPQTPGDLALQIDAVETLIADEMALETAFEGSRYYDLMRIARHRNAAGFDGTSWFAWTIARRSLNLAPYEQPEQVDFNIYNTLLNTNNWYLLNPQY